jgi:hypothetical protein
MRYGKHLLGPQWATRQGFSWLALDHLSEFLYLHVLFTNFTFECSEPLLREAGLYVLFVLLEDSIAHFLLPQFFNGLFFFIISLGKIKTILVILLISIELFLNLFSDIYKLLGSCAGKWKWCCIRFGDRL